jgi:hypothetical protein
MLAKLFAAHASSRKRKMRGGRAPLKKDLSFHAEDVRRSASERQM